MKPEDEKVFTFLHPYREIITTLENYNKKLLS